LVTITETWSRSILIRLLLLLLLLLWRRKQMRAFGVLRLTI
jgi:hypothetical protein